MVSDVTSAVIRIDISLHIVCHFSLVAFKIYTWSPTYDGPTYDF